MFMLERKEILQKINDLAQNIPLPVVEALRTQQNEGLDKDLVDDYFNVVWTYRILLL